MSFEIFKMQQYRYICWNGSISRVAEVAEEVVSKQK